MQLLVVRTTRGLVPQQITVGSGFIETLIALSRTLPDRKRHSTIRMRGLDVRNDPAEAIVSVMWILASLEDERPEPELISLVTACEYLLVRQPIPVTLAV